MFHNTCLRPCLEFREHTATPRTKPGPLASNSQSLAQIISLKDVVVIDKDKDIGCALDDAASACIELPKFWLEDVPAVSVPA